MTNPIIDRVSATAQPIEEYYPHQSNEPRAAKVQRKKQRISREKGVTTNPVSKKMIKKRIP